MNLFLKETLKKLRSKLSIFVSFLGFILLFCYFPYQFGYQKVRTSVFHGIILNTRDTEWDYCIFVPFAVILLAYFMRKRLGNSIGNKFEWWGLIGIVVSLFLYWLGYKADTRYLGFASAQLMLGSFLVYFGGISLLRAAMFPFIFFLFTWPYNPLEDLLAFPLRVLTAKFSVLFLNTVGIESIRKGTTIMSASDFSTHLTEGSRFNLDVDGPCSGINSLFTLIMVSVLYGFFALKTVSKRFFLFFLALPLAMLGNFVRIVMLTIGVLLFGSEFAIGSPGEMSMYHFISGMVVFVTALYGMVASCQLMNKLWRNKPKKDENVQVNYNPTFKKVVIKSAILILLTLVTLFICSTTKVPSGFSQPTIGTVLPKYLENYYSERIPMSNLEKRIFEPGVTLDRRYYKNSKERFLGTIVLNGPVKRSLHRPEICMPGQGWTIDKKQTVTLTINGKNIKATVLRLFRDDIKGENRTMRKWGYYLYSYFGNNLQTHGYYNHIILGIRDSLLKGKNHRWAILSTFIDTPYSEYLIPFTEIEDIEKLIDFTEKFFSKLEK